MTAFLILQILAFLLIVVNAAIQVTLLAYGSRHGGMSKEAFDIFWNSLEQRSKQIEDNIAKNDAVLEQLRKGK